MPSDANGSARLWREEGGSGPPTLVLLHGLGANGAVWDGFVRIVAAKWPGRWVVPDLRGHGRSFHRAPYGFGVHAADVAALLPPHEEVVLLGHSMGGVVAMVLGSNWFGLKVRQVVAFGETGMARRRCRQIPRNRTRPSPVVCHAGGSHGASFAGFGLKNLVDAGSPAALHGVVEENSRFRLAMDPAANAVAGDHRAHGCCHERAVAFSGGRERHDGYTGPDA